MLLVSDEANVLDGCILLVAERFAADDVFLAAAANSVNASTPVRQNNTVANNTKRCLGMCKVVLSSLIIVIKAYRRYLV